MSGEGPREDHPGGVEDAAAYVLGALSEDEARAFAGHLRSCSACREEVAAMQPVVDALPSAVPQRTAPAELRSRVLATVRSEAELRNVGARDGEAADGARRRRTRPAPWRWRLATAGLALALIAAVAVIAFPGHEGTRVVTAQVTAPGARASLQLHGTRGELQIAGMPQSPPGRIYELWVERAGVAHPTDALFTVSSAGRASVGVPGSLAGARAVMVTAEPRGGSSRPTSTPVIVVTIG